MRLGIDLTVHYNDIAVSKGDGDMTIKEFAKLCECKGAFPRSLIELGLAGFF